MDTPTNKLIDLRTPNIRFPLYVKQDFIGPYGMGTSFRKIDISDLEFDHKSLRFRYTITGKPIEVFIKLRQKVKGLDGRMCQYLSIGYLSVSLATYKRIVNALKI